MCGIESQCQNFSISLSQCHSLPFSFLLSKGKSLKQSSVGGSAGLRLSEEGLRTKLETLKSPTQRGEGRRRSEILRAITTGLESQSHAETCSCLYTHYSCVGNFPSGLSGYSSGRSSRVGSTGGGLFEEGLRKKLEEMKVSGE